MPVILRIHMSETWYGPLSFDDAKKNVELMELTVVDG